MGECGPAIVSENTQKRVDAGLISSRNGRLVQGAAGVKVLDEVVSKRRESSGTIPYEKPRTPEKTGISRDDRIPEVHDAAASVNNPAAVAVVVRRNIGIGRVAGDRYVAQRKGTVSSVVDAATGDPRIISADCAVRQFEPSAGRCRGFGEYPAAVAVRFIVVDRAADQSDPAPLAA